MLEMISDMDIPAIVSLMNRAYRGGSSLAGWTSEAKYISGDRTSENLVRSDLFAKPAGTFLKWHAPDDGRMVGCVWLEPLGDVAWYLGSLATDPAHQNAGLGKTILSAAEDWVSERNGKLVRMNVVNVRETLIAWYVRRGYCVTEEIEPFPYGDDRFGKPLRDDLCFVVLEKYLD